jgi:proliferating cell nuclear antigen PCNA
MNVVIKNRENARIFSAMFQNIRLFCEHINLMFSADRLYAQGMDSSHISIFEFSIPKTWFDVYEYSSEQTSIVVGVNVALLFKILNTREETHEIHLKYIEATGDKLIVNLLNPAESKSAFDKYFEIPLIDLESELMAIPEIEYQAEFSLASSNFASLIGQLKQFGADLQIKCSEDEIRLISNSNESGNMSVVVPIDDLSLFAINEGETLNLSFSLAHFHNICAFHKVSGTINLKISDNYPLKATYILELPKYEDDEIAKMAHIVVFLAPRVSDDDN